MDDATAGTRLNRAQAAWEQGDGALARSLYEEHLAATPSDLEARFALGVICLFTGDVDGADRQFTAFLAANPGHPGALEYLRQVQLRRPQVAPFVLRVVSGPHAGASHELDPATETVVGRALDVHVRLPDDHQLSRRHLALSHAHGSGWSVRDLGSSHGTLLDDVPVGATAPLAEGQLIRAGSSALRLERLGSTGSTGSTGGSGSTGSTSSTGSTGTRDARQAARDPAPADAAAGRGRRPPHDPTLAGPLVVGSAARVQLRSEVDQNRVLTAFQANITKQSVSILTLLVLRDDDVPVAVELRGRMIGGAVPQEGDQVAVPDHRHKGALRVSQLQNLETGEIVYARDASSVAKVLFAMRVAATLVVALLVVTFLGFIFWQLVPRLLEGAG